MEKVNKILLIISGVCGALGIILIIAGIIMGVNRREILSSLSVTSADFGKQIEKIVTSDITEELESAPEDLDLNEWQMEQYEKIEKLDINISVGQLDIQEYDGDTLQVFFRKNDNRTEIKQDGRELKIKQSDGIKFLSENEIGPVKVMVPKNQIFEEVDIEIGAGEGSITSLKTDKINVEVGAGSLEITETVQAKTSDWSVGAGSLYLNHLISRETNLDCAVGEINATMDGAETDYRMKGDIGVGSLTFGDSEWDSIGQKAEFGDNSAKKRVIVECGTGEVNVDFTE